MFRRPISIALFLLTACHLDNPVKPAAPETSAPIRGASVPAITLSNSAQAAITDAASVASVDPDVTALNGVTTVVVWYYFFERTTARWFIVERTHGSVLLMDSVDQSTSFGIFWRPVNRYAAASSPGTQRFPDAGDNMSVTFSADGRSVTFGPATAPTADPLVRALANTTQTINWFYVNPATNQRWYIVSPTARQVAMLHHVDRNSVAGILWKPISNLTASAAPSTSGFPDAGDNYPKLSIAANGASVSFGTSTVPPQVTLTASTTTIAEGSSSMLTWNSTGATSCTTSWSGAVPIRGAVLVRPNMATQYTVGCIGDGGHNSASVTVNVTWAPTGTNVTYTQAILPNGITRLVVLANAGPSGTFDPSRRTWLVIHGRDSKAADMADVSDAIRHRMPNDQVLTLDWEDAADDGWFDGENWIEPVGKAAAGLLEGLGFNPKNLNIVGHSWGSYVADELAQAMGDVNLIVALDPPKDTWGSISYNSVDYQTIDFFAHATFSVAFHSSVWGSTRTSTLAHESFVVAFPQTMDQSKRHSKIKDFFAGTVLNGTVGDVSNLFSPQRMATRTWGPWKQNTISLDYDGDGLPPTQPVFEAVVGTNADGDRPDHVFYFNGSGKNETVYEIAPPSGAGAAGRLVSAFVAGSLPFRFTLR
jgi:pimeloyl-ACP methyl ester carboxylesterase